MLILWLVVSCIILLACCLIIFATASSNHCSNLVVQPDFVTKINIKNKANNKLTNNFIRGFILIFIPIATLVLYRILGSSYELNLAKQLDSDISTEKFSLLITGWAAYRPSNETANWLLAKQQMQAEDNIAAEKSYRKLIKLNPEISMYWSELAQLLFLSANNNAVSDEIRNYYKKALHINPEDITALELQGIDYFMQQEYNKAKLAWELALKHEVSIEARQSLQSGISHARQMLGEYLAEIKVELSIDANIANQLPSNSRIFLFAKEAGKSSLPLAATTAKTNKSPISLILNDNSISMNSKLLSEVEQVDVIARISSVADAQTYEYEVIINSLSTLKHQQLKINFTESSMVAN